MSVPLTDNAVKLRRDCTSLSRWYSLHRRRVYHGRYNWGRHSPRCKNGGVWRQQLHGLSRRDILVSISVNIILNTLCINKCGNMGKFQKKNIIISEAFSFTFRLINNSFLHTIRRYVRSLLAKFLLPASGLLLLYRTSGAFPGLICASPEDLVCHAGGLRLPRRRT